MGQIIKSLCHSVSLSVSTSTAAILIRFWWNFAQWFGARKVRSSLLDVNNYSLIHHILILLLHYLVKFRSRSLIVYNNEFILGSACVGSEIINQIATNMSNGYYLSESLMCFITTFLLLPVLKMFFSSTNASGGLWRDSPTVLTFNNARIRAAHSLLIHHFSSATYRLTKNAITVNYATDFQWLSRLSDFLSRRIHSPLWINCCKWPN